MTPILTRHPSELFMTKLPPLLAVIAVLFGSLLAAAPAQAQLSRTFVSAATGSDANNCDRPTPCRSFQGAHDKTNDQGEITVLDPGGYGSVVITKSISIVNDGVGEASVLVSGGATGITVNGGAMTSVNLRGITVQGIGFGGGQGLQFFSGLSLTITKCVFRNHTTDGIFFGPNVSGTSNLVIADTVLADNGVMGLFIQGRATGLTLRAAITRTLLVNNSSSGIQVEGQNATGTINVTVTDSVAGNNGQSGFEVVSMDGHAATSLMVTRSVSANNARAGLDAEGSSLAKLTVGQSAITGNHQTSLVTSGAALQSFGDNYIAGNDDGDPAPSTIARK